MIRDLGLVFVGGGAGASLRYLLTLVTIPSHWVVLGINILGSLIIGLVAGALDRGGPDWVKPLIMTGILGGFTTFSAYSLDGLRMMREGKMALALAYLGGSVLLGLVACWIGYALTNRT